MNLSDKEAIAGIDANTSLHHKIQQAQLAETKARIIDAMLGGTDPLELDFFGDGERVGCKQ